MPRRRALTEAQLQTLFALPTTEADLIRHWMLDGGDLAAVGRRRRDHNRLGFALQLCALRYPGRLLRPGEAIPEAALRFVADQLGADLETLTAYAARFQTRYEQLDALRRCCTDQGCGRSNPSPVRGQAMRTEIGRPSSSIRFRAWTATSTSVARRWSVRERSPSPITCLNLPMAASARARFV